MTALPPDVLRQPRNFTGVVARLSGVNAIVILAALVTGPITARALGAEGRGELAAILAVLTMTPWLLDLGLSQWLARERARGGKLPELLGAALPVALGCSLVGVLAAIPLSRALGAESPVVVTYLQIGLFLAPVSVVLQTLVGLAIGESRWRLFSATRMLGSVVPALAIVILAVVDHLTVGSAAAVYLVSSLASLAILLPLVRGTGRLVLDGARSRAAAAFGAKSWLGTLAGVATNRLDQVLMAGLVASRELGLYAVAVSIASLTYGLSMAVSSALYPRVAEGEAGLAARSCRVVIGIVTLAAVVLGILSPPLIPFVFGSEFSDAVPMVILLLLASIPMAGAIVLTAALNAGNDPAATMRAEVVGLALTVPALIVLLPVGGGVAAAYVSLGAYIARLAMLLLYATRRFGGGWWTFVVPTGADLGWLRERMRRRRASPDVA